MDDHAINERSDSEVESTESSGTSWLQAAVGEWRVWVIAAVAVLVAGYFSVNEGIWENNAESFYVLIFAVIAVVAFAYGVYEVRSRTSPV